MAFPGRELRWPLIGHFVLAKQRLRAIQEELGLPTHGIIQAVQTSTAHAAEDDEDVWASEQGHISCHSAAQWDILSNLIETLEPLEEVTLEIRYSCVLSP